MSPPNRLAYIGNSLPRRCGIATFTTDLQQAVSASRPDTESMTVAMTAPGDSCVYPPVVRVQVQDDNLHDYRRAADALNAWNADAVCLQHEYGIFGGESGVHILTLLSRLRMPVITTLHTVLAEPSAMQRRVLTDIVGLSSKVVVMAEKARDLLRSEFGVPASKIALIPHGIPDAPFCSPDAAKARLGFAGKSTILTFGLLSKNKGIEVMIDAMPAILARQP